MWRSLVWGKEVLQMGMRWRVGDGTQIRLKVDKWIPQPHTFRVISHNAIPENATVADLILPSRAWNVELIRRLFFDQARNRREDAASGSSVGNNSLSHQGWKRLWGLNLPNKIKVSLWRACRGFIPCADALFKRHVGVEGRCQGCKGGAESVVHALWDCKRVKKVWKLTFLHDVCTVWRERDFFYLFNHVAQVAHQNELEWFEILSWFIWHDRNKRVYGATVFDAKNLLERASCWWEGFLNAKGMVGCHDGSRQGLSDLREASLIRIWRKPTNGFVKLNVDGALDIHRGIYGTGAVVRDERGSCVGVLATPGTGALSPLTCEALALVNGLHFCVQAGFKYVVIEGDSLAVINALNGSEEDLSMEGGLIDEAKFLMSFFISCSWDFVPRVCNQAAHCVARRALSLPYPTFWWLMVPDWLSTIIDVEASS
ncbi:uncharacterized protein A4U43_C04F4810 [Asparagus officinalis]|uniref:RNase H type-1 domain-containing protein n=1 Tax=Asparagus officinalis TaxID=4686 RepID=A0A5P1F2T9_ASPOF|nr:uncharacterized protein A4U43_C04F4810 [Asparagus officinalis]